MPALSHSRPRFICPACWPRLTSTSRFLSTTSPTPTNNLDRDGSLSTSSVAPKPSLNIKAIRKDPTLYAKNCVDRNYPAQRDGPSRIQEAWEEWQALQRDTRGLRERTKTVQARLAALRSVSSGTNTQGPAIVEKEEDGQVLHEAQRLKETLAAIANREETLTTEMESLAYRLPNLTSPHTPIGGEPRPVGYINQDASPVAAGNPHGRSHVEIGETLSLLDWAAARSSSGHGWYFLLHEAALLEQALVQYALAEAVRRGWTPVAPPSMVYAHVLRACGYMPRDQHGEQQVYTLPRPDPLRPELCLAGTSEIPLAAMKARAVLDEADLPLKTVGVSRCYRAEAGARGLQAKGLYRVHEFTKVELFAWTAPDPDSSSTGTTASSVSSPSEAIFQEMVALQSHILSSLGLPCRILEMPSHDLGGSASRKQDIEAFFPSRQRSPDEPGWGEVTSASICTDYQTRRLETRMRPRAGGKMAWPYTVNGTALAVPRVLAAILENSWDEQQGCVWVPEVLRRWMGGLDSIRRKRIRGALDLNKRVYE